VRSNRCPFDDKFPDYRNDTEIIAQREREREMRRHLSNSAKRKFVRSLGAQINSSPSRGVGDLFTKERC